MQLALTNQRINLCHQSMSSYKWGQRPEASGEANAHYDPEEAARYTATNQSNKIQRDLTQRALELLDVQGCHGMLADVGCGSGLSGRELSAAGHSWVGLDISTAMLQLGKQACPGQLCLNDMSQGLPLRAGSLDGIVSISAVQWLCAHPNANSALARLFGSITRCLLPGAHAVLQVYPEGTAQADLLLSAALATGCQAGLFVDFPHSTPAKKYYLCLTRPRLTRGPLPSAPALSSLETPCQGGIEALDAEEDDAEEMKAAEIEAVGAQKGPAGAEAGPAGENLSARCCNLAWPYTGCCSLRWLCHLSTAPQNESRAAAAAAAPGVSAAAEAGAPGGGLGERLQQEHATLGRRTVRLLRRAIGTYAAACAAAAGPSNSATCHTPAERQEGAQLAVEAEVVNPALMPCGGTVMVLATLPPGVDFLGGCPGRGRAGACHPTAEAAAAAAALGGVLGGAGGSKAGSAAADAATAPEAISLRTIDALADWVAKWMGLGCEVRACRVQLAKAAAEQQQPQQVKRSVSLSCAPNSSQSGGAGQQAKRARDGQAGSSEQTTGEGQAATAEGQQQVGSMAGPGLGDPHILGAQRQQPEPPQHGQQQGRGRGKKGKAKSEQQRRERPGTEAFFSYQPLATLALPPLPPAGDGAHGPTAEQGGAASEGTGQAKELALGLLRQLKAPTHLVLTFGRGAEGSGSGGVGEGEAAGAGQQEYGGVWQLGQTSKGLARLCTRLGGCLVGCDVTMGARGQLLESSWVVLVAGGLAEGSYDKEAVVAAAMDCFCA